MRPGRTPESVTEEVAAKFAQIADGLRERNEDPEQAAHFLNKLLFCLFAEDIGLLPKGLFTKAPVAVATIIKGSGGGTLDLALKCAKL